MKNSIINVNKNLFELTEKYRSVIPLLVKQGFTQLDDQVKRKEFGTKITLAQAAALKGINLDKLVDLLENEIRKSDYESKKGAQVKVSGSLPCPVKLPLTEELTKITSQLDFQVELDLKSASQGLEWLKQDFAEIESSASLADIFISAGFDLFFDHNLMDRFRRQNVFKDASGITELNQDFVKAGADLLDPAGDYSILSIVPAVFMVNSEELGDRKIPHSWADILQPEFADSVSLPVSDFDLFNAILLNIYQSYGKSGVQNLGRAMKKALHPSQMIKEGGRKAADQPAITIMPYFFTRMAKRFPHLEFIWPEDGAIVSPIFMLTKREKIEQLQPIIDLLASKKIGRILAEQGLFPSVLPEIDNGLPENAKFMWPGWDFLRNQDPGQLLKDLENEFNQAVEVAKR